MAATAPELEPDTALMGPGSDTGACGNWDLGVLPVPAGSWFDLPPPPFVDARWREEATPRWYGRRWPAPLKPRVTKLAVGGGETGREEPVALAVDEKAAAADARRADATSAVAPTAAAILVGSKVLLCFLAALLVSEATATRRPPIPHRDAVPTVQFSRDG